MYILASVVFEKDDKYVFKARNSCCVWEFLAFEYVFIVFFETKQMIIYIFFRNLENSGLKPAFWYTIIICICVGR